jgi:hypothetical protein
MKFNAWPSIESFHRVVKDNQFALDDTEFGLVGKDRVVYKPKVKLHGTNAAIQIGPNGEVSAQSRSQMISVGNDNAGFAGWVEENADTWAKNAHPMATQTIYGEWCGQGIQKGTALNSIGHKIFAIFAIQAGSSDDDDSMVAVDPIEIAHALLHRPEHTHILPWYSWASYAVDFKGDLEHPVELFNAQVADVEECDPWVKKEFGVEGIGEGLVYFPISLCNDRGTAISRNDLAKYMFKAKGEKHKVVKNKKAVEVDPEVANSVQAFVDQVVTEGRLDQAVTEGANGEYDNRQIGPFIAWISKDIKKDVDSGEVELPAGVEWKLVAKAATTQARLWYMEKAKEL